MEPIFFNPIYKHNVWGGFKISQTLKNIPKEQIGESWEIAANKNGSSIIKNGEFKNKTLNDVFKEEKVRISVFGEYCKKMKRFPLLIKFIDAKENLSVQVHPNNFYAKRLEKDIGKTELWYILDCKENANIICGFKNNIRTKEDLNDLKENEILNSLNYIPIKKGDAIFIEAGTVHAIMADTLICEIQQNSDITYRVYDWDRNDKSRPLHIKKSKKVINIKNKVKVINNICVNNEKIKISHQKFFYIDKINVNGRFAYSSYQKTFQAINVIQGNGTLEYNTNKYTVKQGDSFIIPATLGKYIMKGNMEIIMSYIGKKV